MSVLESCTLNSVNVIKNFKPKFNAKYVRKFGMYFKTWSNETSQKNLYRFQHKNSLVYLDNNTFSSFKHIYISDYKCLLQQSIHDGVWNDKNFF